MELIIWGVEGISIGDSFHVPSFGEFDGIDDGLIVEIKFLEHGVEIFQSFLLDDEKNVFMHPVG